MNKKYFLVLGIFLLLSSAELYHKSLLTKKKFTYQKRILKDHYKKVHSSFPNSGAHYLHAITTGDKSRIPKDKLESFKRMGLMHILTPSGLHLGSIMWIQKILSKQVFTVFLLIISIPIFITSGFYPLKRILIFKWMQSLSKENSIEGLFWITFFFDILFGFFQKSPFSSMLSFLFWGTIITHKKFIDSSLIKKLSLNLVLVNTIFGNETSLLSFILNPIVGIMITFLFPPLLLSYSLLPWIKYPFVIFMDCLNKISEFICALDFESLRINPNLFLILVLFSIVIRKYKFLIIFLIFWNINLDTSWEFKIQSGKWLKPPAIGRRPYKLFNFHFRN